MTARRLLRLGIALLRRRGLVAALVLAGLAGGVAWTLAFPPEHRARSAYVPRMEPFARPISPVELLPPSGPARVEVASPEAAEGPDFYRWIVRSDDILTEVAARPVEVEGAGDVFLEDLYGVRGTTPADRRRRAVEALRSRVEAERDRETGVVRIETRAPEPGVAVELNRRILDAVDGFVLTKRRERAEREEALLTSLLESARGDLAESARAHERFLERNRRFENLPALRMEEARLRRERSRDQRRVEALEVELEERRSERARATPMLSVVQAPTSAPPARLRSAALAVALGGLVGLVVGVGAAAASNPSLLREDER